MADIVLQRDVSSLGSLLRLGAAATAVAGGAGDATTTTGATIDRQGSFPGSMPNTLALGVTWGATLATGKTLSIGYQIETGDDGVSWTNFVTGAGIVATGATAASVSSGVYNAGVDLTYARRFIRTNIAPDLSAATVDTATAQAIGMLAGFDRLPQ